MVKANRERYLRSLADELSAQSQRVRNLIGDTHWLTDGAHKEFLLAEVIRRHVPGSHAVGRGFLISPLQPDICSREQDILIVDTSTEAPVFEQGGVIVSFPNTVRAAISVKTRLGKAELDDSTSTLGSARDVAVHAGVDAAQIWCGAFHYYPSDAVEHSPTIAYAYAEEALQAQYSAVDFGDRRGGPDIIATAHNLAYRLYRNSNSAKIVGFDCSGLASALFLAHLLDHLATARGLVRSTFADFADVASVKRLDSDGRVITLK